MERFISALGGIGTHPLFTLAFGFAAGWFSGSQIARRKDLRGARAKFLAAIDGELMAFTAGRREPGISNGYAISQLRAAACAYTGSLFWPRSKSRFNRQWDKYDQQIDKKGLFRETEPNAASFGYHNLYNVADTLKSLRKMTG